MNHPTPPDTLDTLDTRDRLTARISQTRALIAVAHGETGEAFRRLRDDIQDDFMWAISDMLADIDHCVAKLSLPFGGLSHE